jgi:hypothetical protein
MSVTSGDADARDESTWEAERRDFVADHRDDLATGRDVLADTRDGTADVRERLADEREAELGEWERRLEASSNEPDGIRRDTKDDRDTAATRRADERREREDADQLREERRLERKAADLDREKATERRDAGASTTGLALAFAQIARYLHEGADVDGVLGRITEVAVSTVAGCAMASVTVAEANGTYRTPASTAAAALATDEAQYQHGEGPCLNAIDQAIVYAPSFPDPRWPSLADRPHEFGVKAVVSFRLDASGSSADKNIIGSLNAYAADPEAFEEEAREIGLILAAHASVTIGAVRERETLEEMGRNLHAALESRDVIAQAKGILMERFRLTPEEAFDTLRRSSQMLHVKLREIAQRLTETGEVEGVSTGAEPSRDSTTDLRPLGR